MKQGEVKELQVMWSFRVGAVIEAIRCLERRKAIAREGYNAVNKAVIHLGSPHKCNKNMENCVWLASNTKLDSNDPDGDFRSGWWSVSD